MKLGVRFSRLTIVAVAALLSGCAVQKDDGESAPGLKDAGPSNENDTALGSGDASVDPTDTDFVLGDTDPSSDGALGDGACAAKAVTAEQIPLDMLLLVDASASMLDPATTPQKWSTMVAALKAFFDDPASKGISVALTILPVLGKGSCTAATYQTPLINYAPLPGNTAALVKAVDGVDPSLNDLTPLHSVAEGALAGAVDWKNKHPGHTVVAVLATDGKSTCVTSVDPTTSAAKALTQGVQTFTIGMKGADLTQLNAIAAAGGTKKAYDATNISLFSKQMNDIRAMALPCEIVIPPPPAGETFDRNKVNLEYTPGGASTPNTVPYVTSASGCGTSGGWYYDNDTAPTKIIYCPTTCKTIQADTTAKVNVAFGCKSITIK